MQKKFLVAKPEGKGPFGKLGRRPEWEWDGNIKMDVKEVECEVLDCVFPMVKAHCRLLCIKGKAVSCSGLVHSQGVPGG
jgi:hypothetical protein